MSYANNKGADQPAHPLSLISAFVVRCLGSKISLVSVTEISSLMLASVAEKASLSLTWSETPEDRFSHDEAQLNKCKETAFALRGNYLSRLMTKPTKWHVRPAKTQISLGIRPV